MAIIKERYLTTAFLSLLLPILGAALPKPPAVSAVQPIDTSTCGVTKGCFQPTLGSGTGVATYRPITGTTTIQIELSGPINPQFSANYVALGFSADRTMGQDYVVYCTSQTGSIVSVGFNPFGHNHTLLTNNNGRAVFIESGVVDGDLVCRFNLMTAVAISNLPAVRQLNTFLYLLMAVGQSPFPNVLTYHGTTKAIATTTVNVAHPNLG